MRIILLAVFISSILASCSKHTVVVWQPSHQTDTGKDFSEALTCNGISEAGMAYQPLKREYKVWSLGKPEYHHADSGSNTKILHTTAVIDGKIASYRRANARISAPTSSPLWRSGGSERRTTFRR